MSGNQLTTKQVHNAKPKRDAAGNLARREIGDGDGLFLSVEPSRAKSWVSRYRFKGRQVRLVHDADVWDQNGPAPDGHLSLAGARARHAEIKLEVSKGVDPAAAKRRHKADARAQELQRDEDSVAALWGKFLTLRLKPQASPRYYRQVEAIGRRFVLPAWGALNVHELRKRHLIALTDPIVLDRPYLANRTVSAVTAFASWLVDRDVIAASPFANMKMPGKEVERDRVLSDDELRALVKALQGEGPAGAVALVLMHTGARLSEVAGLRWDEIDDAGLWRLPAARTKNRRAHDTPLSRQVQAIVAAQPRIVGCPFVFTNTGTGPLVNMNYLKHRLDARLRFADHWQWHDLRRTCATGLQKLGVRIEVTESVLNHRSGKLKGIVSVYQRHDYADERATALQRWSDYIDALVEGAPAGKVIALR